MSFASPIRVCRATSKLLLGVCFVVAAWPGIAVQSAQSVAEKVDQDLGRARIESAREGVGRLLQFAHVELDILLRVGVRLAQQELYTEAAQVFARCRRDYPASFEARYNLALAEFALQQYPEALVALDGLPVLPHEQELARAYLRGKIYEAQGQTLKAEQHLTTAFSGAPQQENYALDLGLLYVRKRAYPAAIAKLERGTKYNPRSPFLLLALSLAQLVGGHPAEGVATSKKLLELDPTFSPARLLLAFGLYMNGEYDACEKAAKAGLAAPNPPPYLFYLHAAVLLKLNSRDYNRMLAELGHASAAIPRCSLCYVAQSKIHQEQGDDAAAIADLETLVLRLDPDFPQAWYRLAWLYERAGRPADAEQARARFRAIKAEQSDRETELVRDVLLQSVGEARAGQQ